MPQIFQVLRCYKCSVFQIHQTKKINKFECKMCGDKQSIKRHYGIGTGKDCRLHVQKLNVMRGNKDDKPTKETNSDDEYGVNDTEKMVSENIENLGAFHVKQSKWSTYIDEEKNSEIDEKPMYMGDQEVYLDIPKKTKPCKFKSKVRKHKLDEHLDSASNSSKIKLKTNIETDIELKEKSTQDDIVMNCSLSINIQKPLTSNNLEKPIMKELSTNAEVMQSVDKNSRWAQYLDMEDDDKDKEELHSYIHSEHDNEPCVSNTDNLFSLCDDSDLDQLLDI